MALGPGFDVGPDAVGPDRDWGVAGFAQVGGCANGDRFKTVFGSAGEWAEAIAGEGFDGGKAMASLTTSIAAGGYSGEDDRRGGAERAGEGHFTFSHPVTRVYSSSDIRGRGSR